jgi:hypothetical protein
MSVSTSSRRNGRARGYVDGWRPQTRTRELLADVEQVLDRYADYLPMTIRQVYYALVGAERLDKTEAAYERLCYALNQARRARMITFGALRDDGISVMETVFYDGIASFRDETGRRAKSYQRNRQGFLATVANGYSVPVYSASGFASLSAVRHIADRAVNRDVPTVLLHVGDLDPSGESIFAAMTEDAAAFVEADRTLHTSRIEAVRVALTADQVIEHNLPSAPAKASDSRSRTWEGGTCQLEALPPDVLADLVREAILEHLDPDVIGRVLEIERLERAELLGLPPGEMS